MTSEQEGYFLSSEEMEGLLSLVEEIPYRLAKPIISVLRGSQRMVVQVKSEAEAPVREKTATAPEVGE